MFERFGLYLVMVKVMFNINLYQECLNNNYILILVISNILQELLLNRQWINIFNRLSIKEDILLLRDHLYSKFYFRMFRDWIILLIILKDLLVMLMAKHGMLYQRLFGCIGIMGMKMQEYPFNLRFRVWKEEQNSQGFK